MKRIKLSGVLLCAFLAGQQAAAQTDMDAIMMGKGQLCTGPVYSSSSWTQYWEGTSKRENQNLGQVSTRMFSLMGAYGLKDNLNLLYSVPYVRTRASGGTMAGQQGIQDLSLFLKWMPVEKKLGPGTFSLYTIGGVSFPLSAYTPDFLPLSIGLRSRTLSLRLMMDYQVGSFFATASATQVFRDNIRLDRGEYYTTHLIQSHEVEMPHAANLQLRSGYRGHRLIAELLLNRWVTQGGFDITRNNMPFPSNRMNATSLGCSFKYDATADHALSLVGGASRVIAGRNMGQATAWFAGVFYIIEFSRKAPAAKPALSSTSNSH